MWAILLDRGYIGPAEDTPNLRCITKERDVNYSKNSNAMLNLDASVYLSSNSLVGCAWSLTCGIYRWSHEYFDADIDNCILLTNEYLRHRNRDLVPADREFVFRVQADKKRQLEEKADKRRESASLYRANKRRHLGVL